MRHPAEPLASVVRSGTVRRAAFSVIAGLLGAVASCSEAGPSSPGGMAGGGGEGNGDDDCPSDLPSDTACASEVPSYEREVASIVERRCATCHYPENTQSQQVFAVHDDLYSSRQTVLTRVYGCVMPPTGAPSLTPEERRALLQWFVCGAPDN